MGSHHAHRAGSDGFRIRRRVVVVLLMLLLPMLAAAGAGMWELWPRQAPTTALDVSTLGSAAQDAYTATVLSTSATQCAGTSSDRLADGTIPDTVVCAVAQITVDTGPDQGSTTSVTIPVQVYRSGIVPGDRIQVARYPADVLTGTEIAGASGTSVGGDGETAGGTDDADTDGALADGTVYAWVDFSRALPLEILAGIFAVLVIVVGRLRGLAAMIGLGLSYVAVVLFMLPALRLGENPVAVALAGSVAVMTVVLYLAHGISAKTTTALLGTVFGLAATAGLAYWATGAAHLNGLSTEENYTLVQITGVDDLSGVIVCGIIVAGLGVLNDVTITQASAIWEIRSHAPELGFGKLFASGMRVGRDHLASTVYTIAFAYAGAALPTLLLIDLYQQPLAQVLTGGRIAEEIVRTMVGAIGLILAIPLTTAIAASVVASSRPCEPDPDGDEMIDQSYDTVERFGYGSDAQPVDARDGDRSWPGAGRVRPAQGQPQGDDTMGWGRPGGPGSWSDRNRAPRGWQPGVGRAPGAVPPSDHRSDQG